MEYENLGDDDFRWQSLQRRIPGTTIPGMAMLAMRHMKVMTTRQRKNQRKEEKDRTPRRKERKRMSKEEREESGNSKGSQNRGRTSWREERGNAKGREGRGREWGTATWRAHRGKEYEIEKEETKEKAKQLTKYHRRTCCILSWNDFIMYQDVVSFKVCILPFLSMSVPPMFFWKKSFQVLVI